jgi:hypothetical protein
MEGFQVTLRDELIQVAAVAVAIVTDLEYGSTNPYPTNDIPLIKAVAAVREERYRQEEKWGPQHHTPAEWLAILAEEIGEAGREVEPRSAVGAWDQMFYHLEEVEEWARVYLAERFGS